MSNEYLGKARKVRVGNSTRKLILIMLADNANDDGWCWPSHKRIASDCEISDRSVRTHIKTLEKMGFLEIHPRIDPITGNRTGTRYRLKIDSADPSPLRKEIPHHPERDSAPLRKEIPPNHHIEPSIEPSYNPPCIPPFGRGDGTSIVSSPSQQKPKKETPRQVLERVMSKEDAAAVIEHRQRLRKPLTPRAAKILANAFSEIEPSMRSDAVDMMIVSGWTGFKAEWFNNRQASQGACPSSRADMQPSEMLAENVMRLPSQNIGRHTKEALVRWAVTCRGYVLSKDWKAVLVEIDTLVKAIDGRFKYTDPIDEVMALAIEDLTSWPDGRKLDADMVNRKYNELYALWKGKTEIDGDAFKTVLTPEGERLHRRIADRFGKNLLEDK